MGDKRDEQIARELKKLAKKQEAKNSVENDAQWRLDSLLGANVMAPNPATLVTNFNADLVDGIHAVALGASTYRKRAVCVKGLTDNVATAVATITTTNESGSNDGGGYSVIMHVLVFDGGMAGGDNAARSVTGQWVRAINGAGAGVNSVITEIVKTASTATNPAARDIPTLTLSITETSEYVQTIRVTADHVGTSGAALTAVMEIDLLWYGFYTAPVIANA